jgi:trimethylamine---corrinoid protein Co-methyltransferase
MIRLSIFDEEQVKDIHDATLRVLGETGVVLSHPKGRALLLEAGATLDGERVLLPPELVERSVAQAPRTVTLRGRGGASRTIGDGSLHWHNLGGARDVFDARSGEKRPAVLQDVRDSAHLLDALPRASTVTPFFTPVDVPGEIMSLAMYRHSLPFTAKPLHGPGVQNAAEVRFAAYLAEVIGPPAEVLSLSVSPVSPLLLPDDAAAAIIEIARLGIPFAPLPCPTAGTTAPFSISGALVQQNAEVLAALVLAQVVHPGLPIVYCGRLAMMEPRTGSSVWGGVELGLASAGTVQLGHFYHLPVNAYGFSTNSHVLDVQNGFERALNAAIPALAGADELSGIGEMEAGVMGSYAQMVVDDEIAASVARLRQPLSTETDALAVELIAEVMRGSHNFMGQKHSRRYLRGGEVLITELAEREPWEVWERQGRQGMGERAQAKAERLLATHEIPPLSPEQERELDTIMEAAERELIAR